MTFFFLVVHSLSLIIGKDCPHLLTVYSNEGRLRPWEVIDAEHRKHLEITKNDEVVAECSTQVSQKSKTKKKRVRN